MSRTPPPGEQPDLPRHDHFDTAAAFFNPMSTPWTYFEPPIEGSGDLQPALALQLEGDHHNTSSIAGEVGGNEVLEADATAKTSAAALEELANEYYEYEQGAQDSDGLTFDMGQLGSLPPAAMPFDQPPLMMGDFDSPETLDLYGYPAPAPLHPDAPIDAKTLYEAYQVLGIQNWPSLDLGTGEAGPSFMPASDSWSGMNFPDLPLEPVGHDVQTYNTLIATEQSHAAADNNSVAAQNGSLGADAASTWTSARSGKKRSYSESSAAEGSDSGHARSSRSAPFAEAEHGESSTSEDDEWAPVLPLEDVGAFLAKFKSPPFAETARGQILAQSTYTKTPGQTWTCLFAGCPKSFTNWDSFYQHHTRCGAGPDVLVRCQFCLNDVPSGCRAFGMKRHLLGMDGVPVCTVYPRLGLRTVGELWDWLQQNGRTGMQPKHLSSQLSGDLEQLVKGKIGRGTELSLQPTVVVTVGAGGASRAKKPRKGSKTGGEASGGGEAQAVVGPSEAQEAESSIAPEAGPSQG